jgi:hypothetical protein
LESTLESDAHEQTKHTNGNDDNLSCGEDEERSPSAPNDKDCTLTSDDNSIPPVSQRLGTPSCLKKLIASHTSEDIQDSQSLRASSELRLKDANELKECLLTAKSEPGKLIEICHITLNSCCSILSQRM